MVAQPLKLLKNPVALPMDSKSEKSSHNPIWSQDPMNLEKRFTEVTFGKKLQEPIITMMPKQNGMLLNPLGLT